MDFAVSDRSGSGDIFRIITDCAVCGQCGDSAGDPVPAAFFADPGISIQHTSDPVLGICILSDQDWCAGAESVLTAEVMTV